MLFKKGSYFVNVTGKLLMLVTAWMEGGDTAAVQLRPERASDLSKTGGWATETSTTGITVSGCFVTYFVSSCYLVTGIASNH